MVDKRSPEDVLKAADFQFLNSEMDGNALAGLLADLVRECAELSNLEREMVAAQAIQRMKNHEILRSSRLVDAAFKDVRPAGTAGQGTPIQLDEPSPWPDVVDGAKLLDEVQEVITRFCVLPAGGGVAAALFVVHTYTLDSAEVSPILSLLSPEKRCGKTTTLEVLQCLVARPVSASNITSPALFRTVETYGPTLLIDEADSFLKRNEELRGLLNSGHRKASAQIIRTVGTDYEPRGFRTWCAKVLAAIGRLPDTIQDRSIVLRMQRKEKGEKVARLRFSQLRISTRDLREKLVRWAHDAKLLNADPELPADLNDRAADNWRPVIAIADLAGGAWPSKAREAALLLSGAGDSDADDSVKVQLLIDLQALFQARATDRLSSEEIVNALSEMEERPWPEWGKSRKPMSKPQLARMLSPFGVKPKQIWIEGRNPRGYELAQFEDAFERYVPTSEVLGPLEPAPAKGLRGNCETLGKDRSSGPENGGNPRKQGVLAHLADEDAGSGQKTAKGAEDEIRI